MAAVYVSNIVINEGADFDQTFNLSNSSNEPLDLSDYTVESQLRKHAGSSTKTDFTTTIVDASDGRIEIGLASSITSSLKPGRYVYDIVITKTGNSKKTRVIEGSALVREGVTK
tara:strand:- start:46 stop:387 length:342 start_codon:yes stop_codon:yes gene_type:complete